MDGDAFGFFWDRDGKQSSRGGPGFDAGSIKFQTYIDGTNATNLTNGRLLGKTTHGDRSCFFRVGSNGDPWRDHHMEAGEFRGGGKRNDKRKGVISRELLRHGTGGACPVRDATNVHAAGGGILIDAGQPAAVVADGAARFC